MIGFQRLAEAMLHGGEPSNDDLVVMCVGVADAALAGDRCVLAAIPAVSVRLRRYLLEAPWRDEWEGRLWTLEVLAKVARAQLPLERADLAETEGRQPVR